MRDAAASAAGIQVHRERGQDPEFAVLIRAVLDAVELEVLRTGLGPPQPIVASQRGREPPAVRS